MWMIVNAKNGISSYEIALSLGVTQKTAWFMMHRIRLAQQKGSIDRKLMGEVEVAASSAMKLIRRSDSHPSNSPFLFS